MKFNLLKLFFKSLFFILLIEIFFINAFQIKEKYPKVFYPFSINSVILVTENGIRIYDNLLENILSSYDFPSDDRKITSATEAELTAIAKYPDNTFIVLVKKYLYVFDYEGNFALEQDLNEILVNGYYFNLIAHNSLNSYYYYIIAYYSSTEDTGPITIKYCYFSLLSGQSITNPLGETNHKPLKDGYETEVAKYGISCQIMTRLGEDYLACFFQISDPPSIGATTFVIDGYSISRTDIEEIYITNSQSSIIKSAVPSNRAKALICYTKDDNNDGKCVTYNVGGNEFTSEIQYFSTCNNGINGMEVYYFWEISNYMFICSDSSIPKGFHVVKFDDNLNPINYNEIKTEPDYIYGGTCNNVHSFNIIYLENFDYVLINDCEIDGSVVFSGNISLELLSQENNYPIFIDESETEIIDTSTDSKEEIINNIDNLIRNKNPKISYIMKGNDYTAILKPINKKIEESTVNIDFLECEKILKVENPNKKFRIFQLNIENKIENHLVDQVEYKIYDENGIEMDLSVCNNVEIIIEYEIKNKSLLNLEQISNFQNMGVDVFDIKNEFFNDICFPYSDNDTNSDMILYDRVLIIYQNYSICGDGCEYISFNTEKVSANCNCKVKKEVSLENEKGNFQTYIMNTFLYSNFGVIKCYNLVFSLVGKLKNAGFLTFGLMIIIHIPLYSLYFINGTTKVTKFITKEMNKNGYNINDKTKNKKKSKTLRIESTKQKKNKNKKNTKNIKNIKTEKHIKKIKNNPPKKHNSSSTDTENDNIKEENKNNIVKYGATKNINVNNNKIKKNLISLKKKKKIKLNEEDIEPFMKGKKQLNFQILNTFETNSDSEINEKIKNKKKEKKRNKNTHYMKNNLVLNLDSEESNNNKIKKRKNKKKFTEKRTSRKKLNKDNEKNKVKRHKVKGHKNNKNYNNTKKRLPNEFPLILIDANNSEKYIPLESDYVIDNYDYDEAIKYEKRTYCRIFFILLIAKENILNIIFFNPPLELKPIRICLLIFCFSCDFALNAFFYLSDNISDRFHYTGIYKELYTLVNNLTISLTSTIVSFILLSFFETLSQSTGKIENLFREQEDLLKKDINYKVTKKTKIEIKNKIKDIIKCFKIKIILFIIFEFILMLFFFYYASSFCQVYKSTQISWFLDCISSYVISIGITIGLSIIFTLLYKISIKYKVKLLYRIIRFVY